MNASGYICVLADLLRSAGVEVHLYAFDLHYGGRYDHESRQIWINDPEANSALMTLAHEAGHHFGYALCNHTVVRKQVFRERQAYVYGWRILCWVGADALITRQMWVDSCKEAHYEFVK
jgi:hypothetical protein